MVIAQNQNNIYSKLITQVQQGDRRACNELYRILLLYVKDAVRKKAYGVTGLDFDIMVHNIVVKIFENLSKYNERKNLRSWTYRVAINFIIDLHRRKKSLVNLVLIDPDGGFATLEEITAKDKEITDENAMLIEGLLEEIPILKRERFCWYYTDQKTLRNLSLETGKSMGAITSEIFRTKNQLKKLATERGIRL